MAALSEREIFLIEKLSGDITPETRQAFEEELAQIQANKAQEQISQHQEDYATGLKETMYQIIDIVLTDDMEKTLGVNALATIKQEARKLMDAAINEQSSALYEIIGAQFEAKDQRINELTTNNINLNSQLTAEAAEKDARISELMQQLQAKDEQIKQLTAEINKPKEPSIYIPTTRSNPSQSLQSLMAEASGKVKSQMDIVLSGSTYRGKVQITPPDGGSESAESFRSEDTAGNDTNSGDDTTQETPAITPPPLQFQEDGPIDGLATSDTGTQMAGETLEDRIAALEQRVAALEDKNVNGEAA